MTYRWEPKSRLDIIIEDGFKRIDEAIEGVVDRLAWESPLDNYMKQKFRINTDVVYIDPMNNSHVFKRGSPMAEYYINELRGREYSGLKTEEDRDLQRLFNYRMSAMVEAAALAPAWHTDILYTATEVINRYQDHYVALVGSDEHVNLGVIPEDNPIYWQLLEPKE